MVGCTHLYFEKYRDASYKRNVLVDPNSGLKKQNRNIENGKQSQNQKLLKFYAYMFMGMLRLLQTAINIMVYE